MTPEWVSVTDYARIFSVSRPTVYKWIEGGLLVTYRVEQVLRIKNQPPVLVKAKPRTRTKAQD